MRSKAFRIHFAISCFQVASNLFTSSSNFSWRFRPPLHASHRTLICIRVCNCVGSLVALFRSGSMALGGSFMVVGGTSMCIFWHSCSLPNSISTAILVYC